MSGDINVQSFSGKVNISNNLLVGSSHLFVDTVNNRVGLVTNTPDAGLHVNSNAYVHTNFRVGSGIVMNDTTGRITAGSFVGDGSAMTGINSDSGSWVNGTNSNVHLATSTDKVGIGTTSPDCALSVTGDRSTSSPGVGIHMGMSGTSLTQYAMLQMNATDRVEIDFSTPNTDADGRIVYDNVGNSMSFRTNGVDNRLFIKSDGNVGIGTVSPTSRLEVSGINTAHNTTIYPLTVTTISSSSTAVEEGIGTGIEFRVERQNTDNIQNECGAIRVYGAAGIPSTSDYWNMAFRVKSNDTIFEPMTLKYNGNVGIGTTDPQSLLQVPRPAVAYDKVIQLGTQTTYADGDLYSLGFGGNALMGIGLATGTRSVFGRQGMATHIPNTETWGIYTNSWTKLINVDGSTRRVYFGHTDRFNLFYAPTNWSYSTTSTSETNLWTFDVSIPQDGYLIMSSNGHWTNSIANQWVYAKIGVDSADPADTSGFYDSFTGGGASTNGGDFHGYKDSSVSWQDFNWSGTLKVSAGTRTICMRVKVSGGTFSLNGAAVNMLYIPKNYF